MMLAVSLTLTTKHLGIAITFVGATILIFLARESIKEFAVDVADTAVEVKNGICKNIRERKSDMGLVSLLAAIGFGIALTCGVSMAGAGLVTGIILAVSLVLLAVAPDSKLR